MIIDRMNPIPGHLFLMAFLLLSGLVSAQPTGTGVELLIYRNSGPTTSTVQRGDVCSYKLISEIKAGRGWGKREGPDTPDGRGTGNFLRVRCADMTTTEAERLMQGWKLQPRATEVSVSGRTRTFDVTNAESSASGVNEVVRADLDLAMEKLGATFSRVQVRNVLRYTVDSGTTMREINDELEATADREVAPRKERLSAGFVTVIDLDSLTTDTSVRTAAQVDTNRTLRKEE